MAGVSVWISPLMVDELRRIVEESEIIKEDDAKWPRKNVAGRQELEVRLGKEHISFEVSKPSAPSGQSPAVDRFERDREADHGYPNILLGPEQTAKIGSLVDVQDSEDPEGLRVMYYLVQDLKVSRV